MTPYTLIIKTDLTKYQNLIILDTGSITIIYSHTESHRLAPHTPSFEGKEQEYIYQGSKKNQQ
ncbi:MAG: hypothetical protein K8F91_10890 [Candidatus Obscuribacterales bacterium]|nr:hypothetical protein [Candidatus Obscuribacterales bacterium]